MMLSGKAIRTGKHVGLIRIEEQFQPAGVDLSVESVWAFEEEGGIDLDNRKRKLPKTRQLPFGPGGSIHLPAGPYKIVFNELVDIPLDCAALARSRSSLLRMGASVQTALWDPGYRGRSEALLLVSNPHGLTLHMHARVAQLAFIRLEKPSGEAYGGKYQHENMGTK
ncbi:MAG: deoxyuridine 5'-triphosphate nucleotidohydrolase [Candidatus Marsarchaeota archaeon]|nr:deoxyuridine 5'-triphosphate nucleotidohydrolase [Candidatus Marsarchaeota archaeon]